MSDDPHARMQPVLANTRFAVLQHHPVVGSTNDAAVQLVAELDQAHVVVTAEHQTQGRGRLGRPWLDTVDADITPTSLAISATLPAPTHAALVPFAAGLAAFDASVALGVEPALKWPNDLLLAGRKAAGILVERVAVADFDLVVVGTGFNVDWRDVPRDADQPWTSLAEAAGRTIDQHDLLAQYLVALDSWLAELDSDAGRDLLLAHYRACCATLGQPVIVNLADGRQLGGIAAAIDDTGQLLLKQDGTLVTVTSGDVWHGVG